MQSIYNIYKESAFCLISSHSGVIDDQVFDLLKSCQIDNTSARHHLFSTFLLQFPEDRDVLAKHNSSGFQTEDRAEIAAPAAHAYVQDGGRDRRRCGAGVSLVVAPLAAAAQLHVVRAIARALGTHSGHGQSD